MTKKVNLQERLLGKRPDLEIDKLFRALVKLEGSDLHLKVGCPPFVRIAGSLRPLNREPISAEEMGRLIFPMFETDARRKQIFEDEGWRRLRLLVGDRRQAVAVPRQCDAADGQRGTGARRVNNWIPDFKTLHLPEGLETLCRHSQGMILLAGVTGSGKSTTIASMLDWINHNYRKHILTLEDPIEFTFTEDKCLINQREIGSDVKDF